MPRFGDLEAAIMDVVWAASEPLRVREVRERLARDPSPAYNTVQTVTEILHRKGWLTKHRDGVAYRYAPAASREDYVAGLLGEALSAAGTAGDRTATLLRFVETMDPGEVEELRRALQAAKQARKPGTGASGEGRS